jgi:hypothetical protein
VVDFYEACPEEDRGGGAVSLREVRATEAGTESLAVAHHSARNGSPTVGMEVLHFVRVEPAVLIDTAYNEGGAGPSSPYRLLRSRHALGQGLARLDRLTFLEETNVRLFQSEVVVPPAEGI